MYELTVFDLDGTLLDTLEDLYLSVNHALQRFSLPLRTKEEVRGFVGNGIKKLIDRAAGDATDEIKASVLAAFKAHYGEHCLDHTKPYEGILTLLTSLKERGVKTAVVSNKADFATKKLAAHYFGALLLTAVGEKEEAGIRKKPAPDSLLAVMRELGVSKEKTVYIGDSEVDIQTAQNAEVDCISVSWGFKDIDFLRAHGATKIVNDPKELFV